MNFQNRTTNEGAKDTYEPVIGLCTNMVLTSMKINAKEKTKRIISWLKLPVVYVRMSQHEHDHTTETELMERIPACKPLSETFLSERDLTAHAGHYKI